MVPAEHGAWTQTPPIGLRGHPGQKGQSQVADLQGQAISGFLSTINPSYVDDHLGVQGFDRGIAAKKPGQPMALMALTKAPNALGVPLSIDLKVVMCLGNAMSDS